MEQNAALLESSPIIAASTGSQPIAQTITSTISSPFTQRPLVAVSDVELRARVHWTTLSTPHFLIHFDRVCYHEREAETHAHLLEDICQTIFSMTHEGFYGRVSVYLCDLRSPSLLGRKTTTHFNLAEHSIYLVRSSFESAETELVAMVTHAMRFGRYLKHYGITPGWAMLEDAFATFASERILPGRSSYPFFGADPDVIAEYLKQEITLPSLSYAWQSIRFSSEIERRIIAGAFLLYLGDTASDDSVIAFSKCDDNITSRSFELFFGLSLEDLEARWMSHLPKTLCLYTKAERQEMISRWKSVMARRQV